MKTTTLFSLALTAGLVCLQPFAVFAEDQDQKNKDQKVLKGTPGKPVGKVVTHAPSGVTSQGNTVHTQFHKSNNLSQTPANVTHTNKFAVQKNTAVPAAPQAFTSKNVQKGNHFTNNNNQQTHTQVQFTPPQGNRANHYGGHWIAANVHPDWGNSGEHYWNHHHYRWYDGGWVIFDAGYAPTGGSVASAVQQRLAEQGYYNGPIDGDIGPGSSQAIANYQADHGLRPSGHINDSLLDSLGLQ